MRRTRPLARLAGAVTVAAALGLAPCAAAGAAAPPRAATSYACKVKNVNTCVVTIKLSAHKKVRVASTMPDSHPWTMSKAAGAKGYTLTSPSWNGKSGVTEGTKWSALLTTQSVKSGASAVLTFVHVSPLGAPKHYTSFSVSFPDHAATSSVVTITAVVHPKPATGHLLLQRKDGSSWVKVFTFTYVSSQKHWSGQLRWTYPKGTTKEFRAVATAAPGLLTTASGSFKISTAS